MKELNIKENHIRIKQLIKELNEYCIAYYKYDSPVITDKEYDKLFDELSSLENNTGIIYANSPTQKVKGYILDGLNKVKHSKPMLSSQKTKDIGEVKKFLGDKTYYGSFKLDGCTLVVIYEHGKFKQGITRGSGEVGEDVTEACRFIMNLPMEIPDTNRLELRGECVVSWDSFKEINENLSEPYSHPRNLASGSLRNLDLNIVKQRKLEFVVFECVSDVTGKDSFDRDYYDSKWNVLNYIDTLGFTTVERNIGEIDDIVDEMKPEEYKYPCDGLIFEVNSNKVSRESGATSHHENCRIALKWKDEEVETELLNIEWTMGKTGVLTPTAVFKPVEIDGTIVERASLHNISVMYEQMNGGAYVGQKIKVYKANMIIPQIAWANPCPPKNAKMIDIPDTCPICGGKTEIKKDNNTEVLICKNDRCRGKLLGKLTHFVSKNAMNIDGLSEATLERFIGEGFIEGDNINSFIDIYELKAGFYNDILMLDGFGQKSTDKLMDAIEASKHTTLDRFIYSLCIPLIGRAASKTISKYFGGSFERFYKEGCLKYFAFENLDDFGSVMAESLRNYISSNSETIKKLSDYMEFEITQTVNSTSLNGLVFVITGSLNSFTNRDEAKDRIETAGGKVSGSVSKKTNYLVNNDISSNSGKNKKAKELGVPIITENELIEILN